MKTSMDLNFGLISAIWASCQILGVLSIETATTIPSYLRDTLKNINGSEIKQILNNTRRIIHGYEAHNRPYMVYLKLPSSNAKYQEYRRWLCGGVIVHEEFILTSAACIEDVRHFYVVAGSYSFSFNDDRYNNPCIKNGAKKAVWKCIPRNYVFDGHENDNIRWMNNDIAVVKLEDEYDFTRRVRGCDHAPRPICYNNQSARFEEAGNEGSIAGWGSTDKYNDWVNTRKNSEQQILLEAETVILDKGHCKKRWGHRYHNIIDNYMICTRDFSSELSEICKEKYVDCTDIIEESDEGTRRVNPNDIEVHSARHNTSARRQNDKDRKDGGFCENDHGGSLVVGDGVSAMVIGIISACLVKEKTNKCYGPFLYTSVYKNRVLINCAIYKDIGTDCNKLFRASVTHTEVEMSWADHPDGPAKNEVKAARRKAEEEKLKQANATNIVKERSESANDSYANGPKDTPLEHVGVILRSGPDPESDIPNEALSKSKIASANNTVKVRTHKTIGAAHKTVNTGKKVTVAANNTVSAKSTTAKSAN